MGCDVKYIFNLHFSYKKCLKRKREALYLSFPKKYFIFYPLLVEPGVDVPLLNEPIVCCEITRDVLCGEARPSPTNGPTLEPPAACVSSGVTG
jgi:hypothetical protein